MTKLHWINAKEKRITECYATSKKKEKLLYGEIRKKKTDGKGREYLLSTYSVLLFLFFLNNILEF